MSLTQWWKKLWEMNVDNFDRIIRHNNTQENIFQFFSYQAKGNLYFWWSDQIIMAWPHDQDIRPSHHPAACEHFDVPGTTFLPIISNNHLLEFVVLKKLKSKRFRAAEGLKHAIQSWFLLWDVKHSTNASQVRCKKPQK